MAAETKLALVQSKLTKLIDEVGRVSSLHEINAFFQYSKDFVKRVNESFATDGFRTIQHELFSAEVMGVCRIWDKHDELGYSLPTIAKLSSDPDFQSMFEAKLIAGEFHNLRPDQERWSKLDSVCQAISQIVSGERYQSLVAHRDRHIAHPLELLKRELKQSREVGVAARFGDETLLLEEAKRRASEIFTLIGDGSVNFGAYEDRDKRAAELFVKSTFFVSKKEFNRRALKDLGQPGEKE